MRRRPGSGWDVSRRQCAVDAFANARNERLDGDVNERQPAVAGRGEARPAIRSVGITRDGGGGQFDRLHGTGERELLKCETIPVGAVQLKQSTTNWMGINLPTLIPALSIEVELLEIIRNEWKLFDGVSVDLRSATGF